jgi:hypothetical protein
MEVIGLKDIVHGISKGLGSIGGFFTQIYNEIKK